MKYNPKVLVACECSQVECIAFRRHGLEAYSCDLQHCYGGHPEWHIQGDALRALTLLDGGICTVDGVFHTIGKWDLVIAHPPCTYIALVGAAPRAYGDGIEARYYRYRMKEAVVFFMSFFELYDGLLAVENPRPSPLAGLPPYSFFVRPDIFGSRWSKLTYYWVRGLPPLLPMQARNCRRSSAASNRKGQKRSESFVEVAEAMAVQWGGLLL